MSRRPLVKQAGNLILTAETSNSGVFILVETVGAIRVLRRWYKGRNCPTKFNFLLITAVVWDYGCFSHCRAGLSKARREEKGRVLSALRMNKPVIVHPYNNSALIIYVYNSRTDFLGLFFPSLPLGPWLIKGWTARWDRNLDIHFNHIRELSSDTNSILPLFWHLIIMVREQRQS